MCPGASPTRSDSLGLSWFLYDCAPIDVDFNEIAVNIVWLGLTTIYNSFISSNNLKKNLSGQKQLTMLTKIV